MTWWNYPTNFSNGSSVTGVGTLAQYAHYVTGGYFATAFIAMIFLITFSIGVAMSSRKALAASSFITLIFSVYFLRLDMINPVIVFVLIVGVVIGVIGAKEESKI